MPTLDFSQGEVWFLIGLFIILGVMVTNVIIEGVKKLWKNFTTNISEAELGPLKLKTKDTDTHEEEEELDVKGVLSRLESDLTGLRSQVRESSAKLYLIEKVKKDKIEFRQKVRKFTDLLKGDLKDGVETFLEKDSRIDKDLVPKLDDYRMFNIKLDILKDYIIEKALTDWELNGFHKIGAEGTSREKLEDFNSYIDSQIKSYKQLLKSVLLKGFDVEPVILLDDTPITKPLVLRMSDIEGIFEPHLPYLKEAITDIYTSAINWAKVRQEKYKSIESGESE